MYSRFMNLLWTGIGIAIVIMAAPALSKEITGRHHGGDRTGVHGMALFGNAVHYLAHIPTMARPHNEQLIMRIRLLAADGSGLSGDFSGLVHSIRPTQILALDDFVTGADESFQADIFAGNFEHGAPRIHAGVTIEIEEVLVARNLSQDDAPAGDLFYLIGSDESWLVNVISPSNSRQEIVPVRVTGPAPGLSNSFALKVTVGQAANGVEAVLQRAGISGPDQEATKIPLQVGERIWCLDGPDFFQTCQ